MSLQPPTRPPERPLINLSPRVADAAALVAGVLTPLGFAPFGLFPLALLAPAVLFYLWHEGSAARAAARGYLFGLGFFGVGVSWVFVSLHTFGNMPTPIAVFATMLWVGGLALIPGILGYAQARLVRGRGAVYALLWLPTLWVIFEWLRGWILTGFPWLNLGYSQVDTPLAGFAAWAGVYGVSLACAFLAGTMAYAAREPQHAVRRVLPLFVGTGLLGAAAGAVPWAQPHGAPLRVALVQANVPIASKWRPELREEIANRYLAVSREQTDRDLVVWPEAAMPVSLDRLGPVLSSLNELTQRHGTEFVFGAIEVDTASRRYYNSVVRAGQTVVTYRKQHLVPFGEYLPLPFLFRWVIDSMQIPMSNFSPGPADQPPLRAAGQTLGVSVCYEDAFGEEVIRPLPAATLLVNVSEDAWFGDSFAPHQRAQMARMRALETARPMLRAANTGPSMVIDARGVVQSATAQFTAAVLRAEVQPMSGATPYVRFGNYPLVATVLLVVLLVPLAERRRRKAVDR